MITSIYMIISIESYRYDENNLIILICSCWYDHIDLITSMWSHQTCIYYVVQFSLRSLEYWSSSSQQQLCTLICYILHVGHQSSLKRSKQFDYVLWRESCKWSDILLIQIALIWSYHCFESVMYVMWSYYWCDHIINVSFQIIDVIISMTW